MYDRTLHVHVRLHVTEYFSPWKKSSLDECCSSFCMELVWLFCCSGAFPLSVLLLPEEVVPVKSDCWCDKLVVVSSRILLSWRMVQHNRHTKAVSNESFTWCIYQFVHDCTSSLCFLSSSSTSSCAFSHSFFSFSCSLWYCSCIDHIIHITRDLHTNTHIKHP